MREMRNPYKNLDGKPEARPRCRGYDNIKIDLKRCKVMIWIHLAQDRVQW
jgi:hypothetical protein